jgi:hypothetical protein
MFDMNGRAAIRPPRRPEDAAGPDGRATGSERHGSVALHPNYPLLENYARTPEGVTYQIEYKKFIYDENYIGRAYAAAPREAMSNLRFGYLVGSIGHIPASLLDVGYGGGDFLRVAQKAVPEVYGYDIAPVYPLHDIPVLASLFDRSVEIVTFFDSLEHFEDISVVRDLKADYVCVSLPWCHYFSNSWFENWKHRKPDEHLWHFNHESLTAFMKKMGFELLNFCNIEDTIRTTTDDWTNILSAVFRRR